MPSISLTAPQHRAAEEGKFGKLLTSFVKRQTVTERETLRHYQLCSVLTKETRPVGQLE